MQNYILQFSLITIALLSPANGQRLASELQSLTPIASACRLGCCLRANADDNDDEDDVCIGRLGDSSEWDEILIANLAIAVQNLESFQLKTPA